MTEVKCSTCKRRPAEVGKSCRECRKRNERYRRGLPPAKNRTRAMIQGLFLEAARVNELAGGR